MWPWEHLAFGYILGSMYIHGVHRRAPGTAEFVAIAVGTQFPDLVDKPLAWTLAVLPSGTSFAHSIFVAVPVVVFVWLLASSLGRGSVGVAFGIGYLSHLPGDVFYSALLFGRPPAFNAILWPLMPTTPTSTPGLLANFSYYFNRYVEFMGTPTGRWYIGAQLVAFVLVVLLWVYDGTPGLRRLRRTVK